MKRFFILSILVLLFISSKPNTCDCENNKPSIKEAYEKADVVFTGQFLGDAKEGYQPF